MKTTVWKWRRLSKNEDNCIEMKMTVWDIGMSRHWQRHIRPLWNKRLLTELGVYRGPFRFSDPAPWYLTDHWDEGYLSELGVYLGNEFRFSAPALWYWQIFETNFCFQNWVCIGNEFQFSAPAPWYWEIFETNFCFQNWVRIGDEFQFSAPPLGIDRSLRRRLHFRIRCV